ncbi:hypothetical protein SHKM778_56890 [Streptomyces sp. KM77-8]|uniref:CHAT domain-containing protein n=1 Tax=Streptomyces haneummycinicus TaxID=3074435 RepID=A0AAT9HQF1_9ACTN
MGELGAVPWHAARLPRGRRACQLADISYLPSARLLCEVAARPAARTGQVLVVGNPTRDLHHAGEEAEAIHRTFHPDGELLGPGTATPPPSPTGWAGSTAVCSTSPATAWYDTASGTAPISPCPAAIWPPRCSPRGPPATAT